MDELDSKKAFNAMDNLKRAKNQRKENNDKKRLMSEFLEDYDAPTLFEQQKIRKEDLKINQKYIDEYKFLEQYNAINLDITKDPFDVAVKTYKKQTRIMGFQNKVYPIMYMTHVFEELSHYSVLNIKAYNKPIKENKRILFIDPGVNDLTKGTEYTNIKLLHELANSKLKQNEYISIDYPPEVNSDHEQEFIEKSIKNNFRYADNPHYICCIQSEYNDIEMFKQRFQELEPIFANKPKIVGIGCIHNIHPNTFSDAVINFLAKNAKKLYWIHFYGIGLSLIKLYFPMLQSKGIRISFDSTKYRFAVNDEVKKKWGLIATPETGSIFYYNYVKELLGTPLDAIW